MIPAALKKFQQKQNISSELVTEDWDIVDAWTKERSFWMAGVADAQILQAFRDEARKMIAGDSSGTESMNRLHLYLEKVGYKPPLGTNGTIKDLRTWRRMSVALDTNVAMMRGWAYRQRSLKTMRAFPVWQFKRIAPKEHRRKWAKRWQKAYELTKGIPGATPSTGDDDAPGMAMITHPIWAALSVFGNPYPIFDWYSGMGVTRVSRSKSKKFFDLDDPEIKKMWIETPVMESPGKGLEAKPAITEKVLRDSLQKRLKGLARWDGETLVYTDPNGSRPATQDQLVDMWENMPEGVDTRQKESLIEWVHDSGIYQGWSEKTHLRKKYLAGTDRWDDMVRLVDRLESENEVSELYRGMAFPSKKSRDLIVNSFKKNGYVTGFNKPTESWSTQVITAETYGKVRTKKWSIILKAENPKLAKDIRILVRKYNEQMAKKKNPSIIQDSEFLYLKDTLLKVIKVIEDKKTRTVNLVLREVTF